MRRAMALVVVAGAAIVLGMQGAAVAGAGCHTGATQQDATGKDETTVRMIDQCFDATITMVDPGTPVTFVNDDVGIKHNVGGNLWGHFEAMLEGDAFSASFDEPGIYPFACNYHPGMTGAIVVGDGKGIGNGPVSLSPLEPVAVAPTTPAVDRGGIPASGVATIGLLGAGLGAGLVLGIGRLRKTG
jgi:plastocyanin